MSGAGPLVFINNSRETFTATMSGAIATCLMEVGREAATSGTTPVVISRRHPREAAVDWPELRLLDPIPPDPPVVIARGQRARRRLTGWARPDQWQYAKALVPLLRDLDASAVLVNNDPEIAVHLRQRLPGLPVVHWFHNLELAGDRFRRGFAADPEIRSVAVSRYLARAVENVYRLTPLVVRTVPNGVDLSRFVSTQRPRGEEPVVGYLGRVAVEKGLDVLLRAAILVADRGISFSVQVAGDTNWGENQDSPFSKQLVGMFEELSRAGVTVRRLGHLTRAEVPRALAQADIHVVPSRWDEPFGLTVVEGLASGRPVVASAVGGIPEVLNGAGQMFPREDPTALADVLVSLMEDEAAWRHWSILARQRAEQLPWSVTWAGLEALLRR